jgi:hypothetical protein
MQHAQLNRRPAPSEFAPFYAGYVARVPDGDLLQTLEAGLSDYLATLGTLPEARGGFAYAPGKWTLRELLGHVIDAERVFAYRAMRIARGDTTPLPGFDEKAWVPASQANQRSLADLLAELRAVRVATIALLRHLPEDAIDRVGTASDHPVSVRGLAWIIAGHPIHHLGVVRERYLAG